MSMDDARTTEKLYFQNHDEFGPHVLTRPGLFGVASLTQKLSDILVSCIEESLPHMGAEVNVLIRETREALEALGHSIPEDDTGDISLPWIRMRNSGLFKVQPRAFRQTLLVQGFIITAMSDCIH
jgi:hypothetical protein